MAQERVGRNLSKGSDRLRTFTDPNTGKLVTAQVTRVPNNIIPSIMDPNRVPEIYADWSEDDITRLKAVREAWELIDPSCRPTATVVDAWAALSQSKDKTCRDFQNTPLKKQSRLFESCFKAWQKYQVSLIAQAEDDARPLSAKQDNDGDEMMLPSRRETPSGVACEAREPLTRQPDILVGRYPDPMIGTPPRTPHMRVAQPRRKMLLATRSLLDRANRKHKSTEAVLLAHLDAHGFTITRNRHLDCVAEAEGIAHYFEIKSIADHNERGQTRRAIGQLLEYRYRHAAPTAHLWVIFSRPPRLEWIVGLLRDEAHIHVAWVEEGRLSGPDIPLLGG